MYDEPVFGPISEHIVDELNFVVYKNLTEADCKDDYYKEGKGDKRRKRRGLADKPANKNKSVRGA